MFVVNFNEKVSLGLPAAIRFTNNTVELGNAITTKPAGGQTALYDAIAKALDELQGGSRDKKVLIVVSDGGDNASARKLVQVMKLAEASSAVIYTIGLFDEDDPDRNPGVLGAWRRPPAEKPSFPTSSAKWRLFASASPGTFAINTPSDMFQPTRLETVRIAPFG
jgi:hypothetical protein